MFPYIPRRRQGVKNQNQNLICLASFRQQNRREDTETAYRHSIVRDLGSIQQQYAEVTQRALDAQDKGRGKKPPKKK